MSSTLVANTKNVGAEIFFRSPNKPKRVPLSVCRTRIAGDSSPCVTEPVTSRSIAKNVPLMPRFLPTRRRDGFFRGVYFMAFFIIVLHGSLPISSPPLSAPVLMPCDSSFSGTTPLPERVL